jgi:hypothetical protein
MGVGGNDKNNVTNKGFAHEGEVIPETRLDAGIQGGGRNMSASSCHDIPP